MVALQVRLVFTSELLPAEGIQDHVGLASDRNWRKGALRGAYRGATRGPVFEHHGWVLLEESVDGRVPIDALVTRLVDRIGTRKEAVASLPDSVRRELSIVANLAAEPPPWVFLSQKSVRAIADFGCEIDIDYYL